VYAVASEHVERIASLDPVAATMRGVPGHDAGMTDYSPEGIAARLEQDRATLAALAAAPVAGDRDRIAAELIRERLALSVEMADAGERLRELRVGHSPFQLVRQCFDLMPRTTAQDWENMAARMERVPDGLASVRAALAAGMARGVVAAARQALVCAEQAAVWSGQRQVPAFFPGLVDTFDGVRIDAPGLRERLCLAAAAATDAYAATGAFLREDYLPRAATRDAVGSDGLASRVCNGADLDLAETYAWGWDELHRVEAEMEATAAEIVPGGGVREATRRLETDPARAIEGVEPFRRWLQDLMDATIADLDGVHFDIPPPVRRVEAMIAPPGGGAAMYYTGPSEDFSRPGRTWYPTLGRTRFPLWGEVSICYHEGVPGHHLQIAQVRYLAGELSRYQRLFGLVSGHAEGWALYAERIMAELGSLDDPGSYLGMLRAQVMRAVRVVVDIGMHLEFTIPATERFHPGERWTPELGEAFVTERSHFPADLMASEIDRYLGNPAQAISYKVGERAWLGVREEARRRAGAAFDLKAFHRCALELGPMGLDQLRREVAAQA